MKLGLRMAAVAGVTLLLTPLVLRAATKEEIDRAVASAAAHIKRQQAADGSWPNKFGVALTNTPPNSSLGGTALCGLALLEAADGDNSGITRDDPAIQKAANYVRAQCISCTYTYSISCCIMFLDKLGDPADHELIESLAVRLLAGQDAKFGGWTYECPKLSAQEEARLRTAMGERKLISKKPDELSRVKKDFKDLPPEIQQQVQQAAGGQSSGTVGDNSNTQFAILALWIARRQGIPVQNALARIDTRMRASQAADGGWAYMQAAMGMGGGGGPPGFGGPGGFGRRQPMGGAMMGGSSATMTCSGLIGLALVHGGAIEATLRSSGKLPGSGKSGLPTTIRHNPPPIEKDPVVARGLKALGNYLHQPIDSLGPSQGPGGGFGAGGNPRAYYFLFSLERVGVAYALDDFGGVPWYDYGCDYLLKHGPPWDGEWGGESCVDTVFGIMFLRKANLVQDLTEQLRGRLKRTLKSGDLSSLPNPGPGSAPGGSRREPTATTHPGAASVGAGSSPHAPVKETVPTPDASVTRLSDELVNAAPSRQDEVIEKLRNGKGSDYTDALAYAIHKLDGAVKTKAQDALVDRLARFKPSTLADKLKDDDSEVRRAAALAVAMKSDAREVVPQVIELLGDPVPSVGYAAHAALKDIAGSDYGSGAQAIPKWKKWWSENGGK
jgi:hypothetical protein